MDPLASVELRAAGAALATAAATGTLAWLGRRWGTGRFPALTALLLGSEAQGDDSRERGDLRFAALTCSLASGLSWTIALDEHVKALPPSARVTALALGLPGIAFLVTAGADLVAQAWAPPKEPEPEPADDLAGKAFEVARKAGFDRSTSEAIGTAVHAGEVAVAAATTVATNPTVQAAAGACVRGTRSMLAAVVESVVPGVAERAKRSEVAKLVEDALARVRAARARTEDDATREALASMEETLIDYGLVVEEEDADLERIAVRVREVSALARSAEDVDDRSDAFRTLGLRTDASLEDAKRVLRELARIYHADVAAPCIDPEKWKELTAAYERVRSLAPTPSSRSAA